MGDESEWVKLPTDEKCVHKAWKARVAGYEEAAKQFLTMDEKSQEFYKYLGILKKMVTDSNAIAQEKALDAVLAFVENAHIAGKATSEVCSGVISKCLNASRAKTKDKGVEIIMMYIEIEKQEVVQDELIKGLGNKQPKVIVGCIQCLREGLRDFGNKTVLIKPLIKQLQPMLEHREKTVREAAKLLVVEIYRWIGAALKPQLSNLKPVLLTELEGEFEKIPPGKVQQTRFLRSQQDLKAKVQAQAAAGDGELEEEEMEEEVVDPFDLMTPVEILSKIPKDFWDKIEAKKWQERREALEALQKLLESPCLEKGEYGDLMRVLRKVIAKDTNVMLVTLAVKCIHGLASGLRKKFAPYAVECIDAMVEKFREKKVTVVVALREACDSAFVATTLEAISETCVAYVDHKTPSVKAETASFLARCFAKSTPATLPKKLLKYLIAPLLKAINDSTPAVRDSAYDALGTAMKVVGEKPMMAFLADVDALKMAKIKESCDKAVVVGQKSKPAAAAKPAAKPAASKPAVVKAPEKKAVTRPSTAPGKQAAGAKKKVVGGKKKSASSKDSSAPVENPLSDDAVESKAGDVLPADCVASLANSNWKERLAAMEKFAEVVKPMAKSDIPCQALVRTITRKPGLKETNFQVLKHKVELIGFLAMNSSFSQCTADFCLNELVDKVGDGKNGNSVQETLSCIAEACGLEFVSSQVISYAFEQKNPKNQSESLNWFASALKAFGFKVNVKLIVDNLKKGLSATNPAVRASAISALTAMYLYMGAPLRVLFDGEKPALLQQIDTEFEKVQGQKPPAATRGQKGSANADVEEEDEEEDGEEEGGVNVADLVPRTDISGQLTEELMTEMADKNWKIRNEALQKVVSILKEAKFITTALGPLPESLKLRLVDSNKILVTNTLSICQTLATAIGPNIKQHVRILGYGIAMCFGDGKPQIRKAARDCLDTWVDQGGLVSWVEAEVFSEALVKENPNLRADLLAWLAEKLPAAKKLPKDEMCLIVPQLYSCLEDRNCDVRKKAQEALMPLMIHTGYDNMFKQAAKVKPASKQQVVTHLEKARAELPAKPVKAKPAAAAAASAASGSNDNDDEPARPATAPAKAPAKGKSKVLKKPGKAPPTTASKKKGQEEEDCSPPLKASNGKEQRFKDEKTLKVLKWNFTAPRGEFLDQLRTQMEPTFSKTLLDQLFHADFKHHIKAIDTLNKVIESLADATLANLDLLLKWLTLRFFDTNTTVLMKVLEYAQGLFALLDQHEYHMHELEASAFIPYLINKVGDPKENVRKNVRAILKMICKVFPACKMFSYIIDGLKSKNAKQRTECLEELGNLIDGYGINVCQPSAAQALKLIAGQISDRDNNVRNSALNTIVTAFLILGETTYKYLGNLNDKDLGMLEERIKRSSKQRPPSAVLQAQPQETRLSPSEERHPPRKGKRSIAPEDLPPKVPPQAKKFLDLDDDEQTNYEMPKLIQMDLTDLLDEPVVMPTAKTKRGGATVKMLSLSNDVKLSLDMVISHIGSTDIQTSLESLNQVDELLKNEEKREVLMAHVDQLLVVCAMQMRVTHTKHMGDSNTEQSSIIALYKNIIGVLLALLQCPVLASAASPDVLKDLVFYIITILLDTRLATLEEGPQVGRAVNVLVVKIVNKCDPTSIMSALIHLLKESLDSESVSAKFLDVIMKCLWRSMRILPNIIDDMDLDVIIGDLHQFLVAFPSNTWKRRSSDTPLRTIKTILHTLARIKGHSILNHLSQVTLPCEVEAYLCKVLETSSNNNTSSQETNGVELRAGKKDPAISTRRISKSMHDILAEIFKKIGSKENTREGLNDLYDFKSKYPSADLDPFLTKCSQFFRDYIERGLKNIEMERHGKMKAFSSTPNMASSDSSNSLSSLSATDDNADPAVYIERLKLLRARCGLDNTQIDKDPNDLKKGVSGSLLGSKSIEGAGSNSSISSTSSNGMPNLNVISVEETFSSSSADVNPQMLADIRRRLDRIKNRQT